MALKGRSKSCSFFETKKQDGKCSLTITLNKNGNVDICSNGQLKCEEPRHCSCSRLCTAVTSQANEQQDKRRLQIILHGETGEDMIEPLPQRRNANEDDNALQQFVKIKDKQSKPSFVVLGRFKQILQDENSSTKTQDTQTPQSSSCEISTQADFQKDELVNKNAQDGLTQNNSLATVSTPSCSLAVQTSVTNITSPGFNVQSKRRFGNFRTLNRLIQQNLRLIRSRMDSDCVTINHKQAENNLNHSSCGYLKVADVTHGKDFSTTTRVKQVVPLTSPTHGQTAQHNQSAVAPHGSVSLVPLQLHPIAVAPCLGSSQAQLKGLQQVRPQQQLYVAKSYGNTSCFPRPLLNQPQQTQRRYQLKYPTYFGSHHSGMNLPNQCSQQIVLRNQASYRSVPIQAAATNCGQRYVYIPTSITDSAGNSDHYSNLCMHQQPLNHGASCSALQQQQPQCFHINGGKYIFPVSRIAAASSTGMLNSGAQSHMLVTAQLLCNEVFRQ